MLDALWCWRIIRCYMGTHGSIIFILFHQWYLTGQCTWRRRHWASACSWCWSRDTAPRSSGPHPWRAGWGIGFLPRCTATGLLEHHVRRGREQRRRQEWVVLPDNTLTNNPTCLKADMLADTTGLLLFVEEFGIWSSGTVQIYKKNQVSSCCTKAMQLLITCKGSKKVSCYSSRVNPLN